jgi:tetratricopeptide (TPR) repeat protein
VKLLPALAPLLVMVVLAEPARSLPGPGETIRITGQSPAGIAKEMRRLRHDGQPDGALGLVGRLSETTSSDPRVRGEQAQALLDQGLVEEAAAVLALGHPKGQMPAPFAVAVTRLQFERGDLASARTNLEQMLPQLPANVDLRVLSVRLSVVAGDHAGARRTIDGLRTDLASEQLSPLEATALRAHAADMMGSDELLEKAIGLLEHAHELQPRRADVTALLVRALSRWHRADQAEALAVEALKTAKGSGRVELLYSLGSLRLSQIRDGEARELFEQALELKPEHLPSRLGLARCHLAACEPDPARALVVACLEESPKDLDALALLSEVACHQREWDAAALPLEDLLEIKPRHLRGLWLLSRVRARQGRVDETQDLVARYEARKLQLQGGPPGSR